MTPEQIQPEAPYPSQAQIEHWDQECKKMPGNWFENAVAMAFRAGNEVQAPRIAELAEHIKTLEYNEAKHNESITWVTAQAENIAAKRDTLRAQLSEMTAEKSNQNERMARLRAKKDRVSMALGDASVIINTLRAQLDALQSGDELPEPDECEGGWESPCVYYYSEEKVRQAQAMARAKLLAELGKVEAVAWQCRRRDNEEGWGLWRECSSAEAVRFQAYGPNYEVRSLYPRPLPAQTSSLPERDSSKPAEAQGLFHKFIIMRTDGSDSPGGKHHGCEYFVLDVDHDPHAKAALQAYAAACAQSHPQLSEDLIARHGQLPAQDVNAELVEVLGETNGLLAAMLHEPRLPAEISEQMVLNHAALANAKAAQQKGLK